MKVLITGADGFVGKNLALRLSEFEQYEVLRFTRGSDRGTLAEQMRECDAIVHLAGENRPEDPAQFRLVNADLTREITELAARRDDPPPILFASSAQAGNDTPYGRSKRAGEEALEEYGQCGLATVHRFPGIFGKWCRPNYNSVVATFAHNAARGLDLPVNDPEAPLDLVYIDDVMNAVIGWLEAAPGRDAGFEWGQVDPVYRTSVGEIADRMQSYAALPETRTVDDVGTGFSRALYSTYVSYLPPEKVAYDLTVHSDPRGRFAEMLRTRDAGQVSFFTAGPGVTRGGHYHHTKTEKFLIVQGEALFRFRNMASGDTFEMKTSAARPRVVDTVPGWAHDITNIGDDEMIVVLWANEMFEPARPDTIAHPLESARA